MSIYCRTHGCPRIECGCTMSCDQARATRLRLTGHPSSWPCIECGGTYPTPGHVCPGEPVRAAESRSGVGVGDYVSEAREAGRTPMTRIDENGMCSPIWDNESAPEERANAPRGLTRSSDYDREGLAMKATRPVCIIDGCDRPNDSRGLCSHHRQRAERDGTLHLYPKLGHRSRRRDGETWTLGDGYTRIYISGRGVLMHHRYIMEQHIGRELARGETVHHINGDRSDNRVANLELWFAPQPYGQRVSDLIDYVVTIHRDALLERLAEADG